MLLSLKDDKLLKGPTFLGNSLGDRHRGGAMVKCVLNLSSFSLLPADLPFSSRGLTYSLGVNILNIPVFLSETSNSFCHC